MISTHILDTSQGHPAAGVEVNLEKQNGAHWDKLFTEKTNADGRISFPCAAATGTYRLHFDLKAYFQGKAFFPEATIVFAISDSTRKYHVPLLLNPYGYSTYRGS